MKKLLLLIVFISTVLNAQDKYLTKSGMVSFEASVPSFEQVSAKNNSVTSILNTDNGEFASLALIKGFRFKNALMEEHFNENYAESDQFPKAVFKGKFQNFSITEIKSVTTFKLIGSLTFHGVTKPFENINIEVSKKDEIITLTGSFKVKASDFNIKIPKIVSNKIADYIEINFSFDLLKK